MRSTAGRTAAIAALGVVYGDIGTSPLYAVRECFGAGNGIPVTQDNVLGVMSLILWSLIMVVSIKYVLLVLRADNAGEGGIMAMMALVTSHRKTTGRLSSLVVTLGILGAALLYGDGVITPSISVLSAAEGLKVLSPSLSVLAVPATVLILAALFAIQRRGTGKVGGLFGPVMLLWFAALALLGAIRIASAPSVLLSINPSYALSFLARNGPGSLSLLGSVFLVVTGAEALYADVGHFGRNPIRAAWYWIVLPSLCINYLGQGALLIENPGSVADPFFLLVPKAGMIPLLVLATAATVIASQAVISGVFSLTKQAAQLGYLPRVSILHTSEEQPGQIYVPLANWVLFVLCVVLVGAFGSSDRLAAAYGIAVSATMLITSFLFIQVATGVWHWPKLRAGIVGGIFMAMETAFLVANSIKVLNGGWFSVAAATFIFVLMTTWKTGRLRVQERLKRIAVPIENSEAELAKLGTVRVPGTACYLVPNAGVLPHAALIHMRLNKALHERVVVLCVHSADEPYVEAKKRRSIRQTSETFWLIELWFGFMEIPNVPKALRGCRLGDWQFHLQDTVFFVGRAVILGAGARGMTAWRRKLFALMSRTAHPVTAYFNLPHDRVVEVGSILEV